MASALFISMFTLFTGRWKDTTAGALAGMTAIAASYPVDTVRVKLQTQDIRRPKYNGIAHCFFKTLQSEGLHGLYRGMTMPLIGSVLRAAIGFTVFGIIKTKIEDSTLEGTEHSHSVR